MVDTKFAAQVLGVFYDRWFADYVIGVFHRELGTIVDADRNDILKMIQTLEDQGMIWQDDGRYKISSYGIETYEEALPASKSNKRITQRKHILEILKVVYDKDVNESIGNDQLTTKLAVENNAELRSQLKYLDDIGLIRYNPFLGGTFLVQLTAAGDLTFDTSYDHDSESTSDQTIVRIKISPTQGYAGDNIVLEAWVSKPDTAVHLDIIDENGKRRMNTGQVIFTNPFKHVLTLSKQSLGTGKYNAVFYTTNIDENITGTFEFLTSDTKLETIPHNMHETISENKPSSLITNKKWDVFISHASEDKETVAKPLAEKLHSMNLDVWYDESSLKWGKSLSKMIDEGLSNSLFGIVILSKVFFQKTWTRMELDGLIAIMTSTRQDNILPLRYEISNEEVAKVSPILAGIFSRSWDEGIEKLANEVKELVDERKSKKK